MPMAIGPPCASSSMVKFEDKVSVEKCGQKEPVVCAFFQRVFVSVPPSVAFCYNQVLPTYAPVSLSSGVMSTKWATPAVFVTTEVRPVTSTLDLPGRTSQWRSPVVAFTSSG